jgi:hypothetical protein
MYENNKIVTMKRSKSGRKRGIAGQAITDPIIYDKLSYFLDGYASLLDEQLKHRETSLRHRLIEGFANLRECTKLLGRLLWEYKRIFRPRRIWNRFITEMAQVLRYDRRTLYRWVRLHEQQSGIQSTRKPRKRGSTGQEAHFLLGRMRIREAIAPFPEARRLDVLAQMIACEAFETWNIRQPFTLRITEPLRPEILLRHPVMAA